MTHTLVLITLPLLFLADYAAIVAWLLRTSGRAKARPIHFGLRSLLGGTALVAVHLATITAFLAN